MTATMPARSLDADVQHEQGYANWVLEQLDRMVDRQERLAGTAADVGTHRALIAGRDRMLEEIAAAVEQPVIGRLDTTDMGTLYIGKVRVEAEDDEQPEVISWQAPIAVRFYQAGRSDPMSVGRKRTIQMRSANVTGLADEVLITGFVPPAPSLEIALPPVVVPIPAELRDAASASAAQDIAVVAVETQVATVVEEEAADLRAPDLLLEELDRDRTGEMHEVVTTIQADQDRLIRSAISGALIIQGGPGTGKTAVGLHRAAWVLYDQRSSAMAPSVLVVGPNRTFVHYIRSVLPSLGEQHAAHASIDELALSALSPAERKGVEIRGTDALGPERVKGDARMARVLERAVWAHGKPEAVSFDYGRFVARVPASDVAAAMARLAKRRIPYATAEVQLGRSVADLLADDVSHKLERTGQTLSPHDRASLRDAAIDHLHRSGAIRRMVPKLDPKAVLRRLYEDASLRNDVATGFSPTDRNHLARSTKRGGPVAWTAPDIVLLDELAALIGGSDAERFAHVVVDEAQDLSPMTWRMIRRRNRDGSYTILGDLAQGTSAWSASTWDDVVERLGLESATVAELALGYRVPREVMDFAGGLLPEAAPNVIQPRSFRSTSEPVVHKSSRRAIVADAVAVARSLAGGAVAIISPPDFHDALSRSVSGSDIAAFADDDVRGLEYDHVVVVEPALVARGGRPGLRRLYVALTRATRTLHVVHSRALPVGLRGEASEQTGVRVVVPGPLPDQSDDATEQRGRLRSAFERAVHRGGADRSAT